MITVIGSSSIDFVVETLRVPERGETLMGENFTTFCGGKGANQAVAIARLGEKIQMIGSVGDDDFGQKILKNLTENGVDTSLMNIAKSTASGSAHIFIEAGDNRIVVVAGANNAITPSYIKQHIATLQQSKVVLIQYEIPRATIEYVASLCQELSIPLIINPAPMKKVSDATLQAATYLTPNEVEAKQLFPDKTLEQIVLEYPEKLIITQGSKGVLFAEDGVVKEVPAHKVEVVDTTGAGDAFNAGFCVGIAKQLPLSEAIDFGNRVAAKAVQKLGAQSGLPYLNEL